MKGDAFLALGGALFASTSLLSGGSFDGISLGHKKSRKNRYTPHVGKKQCEKALKRLEKERKTTTASGEG